MPTLQIALITAERTLTWMCGIKLKDKVPGKELRERLGLDNFGTTAKQVAMLWHVLDKEDNNWVKKCMAYEVEGA